jgi:hypothetical protein
MQGGDFGGGFEAEPNRQCGRPPIVSARRFRRARCFAIPGPASMSSANHLFQRAGFPAQCGSDAGSAADHLHDLFRRLLLRPGFLYHLSGGPSKPNWQHDIYRHIGKVISCLEHVLPTEGVRGSRKGL